MVTAGYIQTCRYTAAGGCPGVKGFGGGRRLDEDDQAKGKVIQGMKRADREARKKDKLEGGVKHAGSRNRNGRGANGGGGKNRNN